MCLYVDDANGWSAENNLQEWTFSSLSCLRRVSWHLNSSHQVWEQDFYALNHYYSFSPRPTPKSSVNNKVSSDSASIDNPTFTFHYFNRTGHLKALCYFKMFSNIFTFVFSFSTYLHFCKLCYEVPDFLLLKMFLIVTPKEGTRESCSISLCGIWRDGSVGNNSWYSCIGCEFSSQYLP